MTAILPIACRCGATMRLVELRDGFECRCGMYVDHGAVLAAAGAPLPDAAFQQGEPWKDGEPGIRISDQFANAVAPCWDTNIEVDPAKFSDAETLQRACADAFERSGLRYIGKIEHGGRGDLTIEGETVERHRVYALVPVGQEAEAVRGVVQFILRKHGPGRIWAHGDVPIGPLKRRADAGWRGAEVGGVLHVVMGCYYFHRPEPARATVAAMPKRTTECDDQISTAREMPANWQSGTDADRRRGDTAQVVDAERPAEAHPGAPSKLPGYGGGK